MEDGFLTRDMQGFKGGLDYSSPPESIPDCCAIELSNCEFSVEDGGLQTVPGVRPVLELGPENEITCLFYNKARKEYYFAVRGKLNRTTDFTSHSEMVLPLLRLPRQEAEGRITQVFIRQWVPLEVP